MYSDNLFKIINDARLVFAVTLALVVMLGLQLSSLLWQFVPLPVLPEMSRDDVNRPSQTVQQPQLDARQKADRISAQHLFGQVRNDAPVVEQKIQDAPTSTLKYKLRGIFFSSDQALASVILEKNANDEEFYRLGDEVDRNIFIEQIQPDHIIINRNGRLEKLVMEKPTAELNAKMASLPAARQTDAQATAVLRNYKRRYKDNPMALARRFQAQPVYQDGKNIGYKLKALRGERLLQQLNLKPDDVFVAVNGIGLDKPFQALDALKSLTTAEDVSLTVLRDGSEQTLDFTLN